MRFFYFFILLALIPLSYAANTNRTISGPFFTKAPFRPEKLTMRIQTQRGSKPALASRVNDLSSREIQSMVEMLRNAMDTNMCIKRGSLIRRHLRMWKVKATERNQQVKREEVLVQSAEVWLISERSDFLVHLQRIESKHAALAVVKHYSKEVIPRIDVTLNSFELSGNVEDAFRVFKDDINRAIVYWHARYVLGDKSGLRIVFNAEFTKWKVVKHMEVIPASNRFSGALTDQVGSNFEDGDIEQPKKTWWKKLKTRVFGMNAKSISPEVLI